MDPAPQGRKSGAAWSLGPGQAWQEAVLWKQLKDAVCGRLRVMGNPQGGTHPLASVDLSTVGKKERELNQAREAEEKGRGPRRYDVGSTELG